MLVIWLLVRKTVPAYLYGGSAGGITPHSRQLAQLSSFAFAPLSGCVQRDLKRRWRLAVCCVLW